jgi:hypothetical protein
MNREMSTAKFGDDFGVGELVLYQVDVGGRF